MSARRNEPFNWERLIIRSIGLTILLVGLRLGGLDFLTTLCIGVGASILTDTQ
jgi:hypothetical protein